MKVLDASAMIAFLRDEAGADVVQQALIQDPCIAHAMNLCEVYRDHLRSGHSEADADVMIEDFLAMGVSPREDLDPAIWKYVARNRNRFRASFADWLGMALTDRVGGTFLTADHGELDAVAAAQHVRIQFIR